jgi:hypothetical protein
MRIFLSLQSNFLELQNYAKSCENCIITFITTYFSSSTKFFFPIFLQRSYFLRDFTLFEHLYFTRLGADKTHMIWVAVRLVLFHLIGLKYIGIYTYEFVAQIFLRNMRIIVSCISYWSSFVVSWTFILISWFIELANSATSGFRYAMEPKNNQEQVDLQYHLRLCIEGIPLYAIAWNELVVQD